ncbi:glutactin-like [Macrosteles quadrilineatus]|uniref:glutactin-like n=1 Tax=Macrosteles quadrilineatus TaxID=74068 RepID=UPI0023E34407|nr:glutactin-like [Macrosteles quadrilineatus]
MSPSTTLLLVALSCTLVVPWTSASEGVQVTVGGLGEVLGSTSSSAWTSRTIYQFQGIPYAESPSKENRFKLPIPSGGWSGVLNATVFRNKCPQANNEKELLELQQRIERNEDVEDCLHLNIYTPQVPLNNTCSTYLPVMFYIHGGSFRVGSARDFLPDFFLEEDIVLVVIQYRLGPLGFLSFGTEEAPGNMGLHDQLMALHWTNRYVNQFCGNPRQVTIFGQSSGAAGVTLLMASPLVTPGLFQRVIVQSGSALCDWAVDFSPVEHAETISRMSRCDRKTHQEMVECLRNQSVYQLLMAHSDFLTEVLINEGRAVRGNNGGNHAVVEKPGKTSFLVEDPRVSFQDGRFVKVPMMVGVTKHEGSFFLGNIHDFILERNNATNNTDYLINDFLKATLQFSGIDDTTGAITDVFLDKYFKIEEIGNFTAMVPGLVDICGVTLLKACTLQQARRNAHLEPTFLYTFNYKGQYTKFGQGEEAHHYPFPGGVAHSNDLLYLFPNTDGNLTGTDRKVAQTIVQLWTSFAADGYPKSSHMRGSWLPMTTSVGPYLRIDDDPSLRENFYVEYNIAATEGLDVYMQELSRASTLNFVHINIFVVILINVTCR